MAATLATQKMEVAYWSQGLARDVPECAGYLARVANMLARERAKIGIRIALGSTIPGGDDPYWQFGSERFSSGLFLGLIFQACALRAMHSMLDAVGMYDAPTIFAVVLTLSAVTIFATTLPALRVARIDPAKARSEE